ncbi:hypothetical protein ACJJTC_018777 [Scirpophaga incertulas]
MELDMPLVTKCFGVFPPKYATYLISIFGMSSGGVGLAGLVLYSIAENSIMRHFGAPTKVDEDIKKLVLMCVGLISLLIGCGKPETKPNLQYIALTHGCRPGKSWRRCSKALLTNELLLVWILSFSPDRRKELNAYIVS